MPTSVAAPIAKTVTKVAAPPVAAAAARSPGPAAAALAAARSAKVPAASSKPPAWEEVSPPVNSGSSDASPAVSVNKEPEPVTTPESVVATAAVMQPSAALPGWDGNWPALVTTLPVRGVAHQLAIQSELTGCDLDGAVVVMRLRLPIETLLSAGSADKLSAALSEHFGKTIRLATEIGAVSHTAFAASQADQAERQHAAELTMQTDPFVQTLMREFGATIVPGSIRPV